MGQTVVAQRQLLDADRASSPGGPVVVVGAGPVGVHTVKLLLRRNLRREIILYGDEPWAPYNRVALSAFVAGNLPWNALANRLEPSPEQQLLERHHCRVTAIDPDARTVTDKSGHVQHYGDLVLATGSRPHIPDVPGAALAGVYTFRDMNDAQRLLARLARSRLTVVVGGGLLGLEAARAMRRANTHVTILEHSIRLMFRQLDDKAAELLRTRVEDAGIKVRLRDGLNRVLGDERVEGIELRSGKIIPCDTLVFATGIRPNIELALNGGLSVGRGIRVDDRMRTSRPHVYAVGECAEHDGQVYGLVAPGLEQAAVAAEAIVGGAARYRGSVTVTRLKVLDHPVLSVGKVTADQNGPGFSVVDFGTADGTIYRRLVTERGRLVGASAIGPWDEAPRVQEAVTARRRLWPWQRWRFRRQGQIWPASDDNGVQDWPAQAIVCQCRGVTRGELGAAMTQGCRTVSALSSATNASTVCGNCRPLLEQLLGTSATRAPAVGYRGLTAGALATLLLLLPLMASREIPYNSTAQVPWQWDQLWRDGKAKQVSGYTLLGISVLISLLSLRKRWRPLNFGQFSHWRSVHAVLGALTLMVLALHTGLRLGHHLNLLLTVTFAGLLLAGALLALIVALEHRIPAGRARRWRARLTWLHVLIFWPFPALLGVHVLMSYYF